MMADGEQWAAVRPSRVTQAAPLRAAVAGSMLLVAVVLVSVTLRPGSPVILYEGWNTVPDYSVPASTVVLTDNACERCMTKILKDHEPWKHDAYLDPEMAMSCVRGDCREAANNAMKSAVNDLNSELQADRSQPSTTQLASARMSRGADTTSMEQFAFDEKALDQRQLKLNWKRARVFAHYFGAPSSKKEDLVMTKWVPPLDPVGRPVPSWLTFQPTNMDSAQIASAAQTANALQLQGSSDSIWTPPHALQAPIQSLAEVSPAKDEDATMTDAKHDDKKPQPGTCLQQTSCHGCTGTGCHWCAGDSICAASCPVAYGAVTFTKMEQCNAQEALLTEGKDPAAAAKHGASEKQAESPVVENQRKNREALKNLVHLSKITAGNTLVNTEMAMEFRLRAEDVHRKDDPAGPSLAQALAPLNDEQTDLNHQRQMLYFRMETDIHPGEATGDMDNFAKPTTSWSLIGRPMTGWLHWGDDNDGGFLNPAGGETWDPAVVNPAEDRGSYGPAVNAYRARHPHPADEEASMAGGALFGT